MTNSTKLINSTTASTESKEPDDIAGHSVLVLIAFFFAILTLFLAVLGFSYLYYKHATKKRKAREEEEQRGIMDRTQQIRYRALAAAQCFRGVPNWYSPNPKEEGSFLLGMDMAVVPMQISNE